jgi:hypothetical protein
MGQTVLATFSPFQQLLCNILGGRRNTYSGVVRLPTRTVVRTPMRTVVRTSTVNYV